MADPAPIETANLDRYGNAALEWARAREALAAGPAAPGVSCFLGTTRPDGRPHVAGVGARWHDGEIYFVSGPGTRKSRNLARNPACTLSLGPAGIDLVLEGDAARVVDAATVAALAAAYREGGWPAEADGDALTGPFSAPSAGPPPWHLYRFSFHTVIGVATAEPFGATRWRFAR